MGCFLIGATGEGVSRTGEALLGSVSDNPYDVRTFMKQVNTGTYRHLGSELISTTEHTLVERGYFARAGETTRGINEAGLAFTCAMIIEDEAVQKPASPTPFADLTTEIMQTCASVAEAVEVFSAHKAVAPAYSVLLADRNGELVHAEVGSFGMAVYDRCSPAKPGVVLAVNCYLSKTHASYNAPHTRLADLANNNQARRQRGEQLAKRFEAKLDVNALKTILSDHENRERDPLANPVLPAWGFSICNHGTRRQETYPRENLPWGTVSSEILQPAKRLFWYAYGWPCGQNPEYGDQLFQEESWGEFLPFAFQQSGEESLCLTRPDGKLTEAGRQAEKLACELHR